MAASVLAAFGVTLVNFAQERSVDAQTALTFLVFLIAFGGLHMAVRAFAPRATPASACPGHRPDRTGVLPDLSPRLRRRNRSGQLPEVVDPDRGRSGVPDALAVQPGLDLVPAPISEHHLAHLVGSDPAPQPPRRLGVPPSRVVGERLPALGPPRCGVHHLSVPAGGTGQAGAGRLRRRLSRRPPASAPRGTAPHRAHRLPRAPSADPAPHHLGRQCLDTDLAARPRGLAAPLRWVRPAALRRHRHHRVPGGGRLPRLDRRRGLVSRL